MSKAEKRELRTLFRGYSRLDKRLIAWLQAHGLTVDGKGKHFKVCRADGVSGMVSIAKTPSDYRCGLNICFEIIRLLEAV